MSNTALGRMIKSIFLLVLCRIVSGWQGCGLEHALNRPYGLCRTRISDLTLRGSNYKASRYMYRAEPTPAQWLPQAAEAASALATETR